MNQHPIQSPLAELKRKCLSETTAPRSVDIRVDPLETQAVLSITFGSQRDAETLQFDLALARDITDNRNALTESVVTSDALLVSYEADSNGFVISDQIECRFLYGATIREDTVGEQLIAKYVYFNGAHRNDTQQTAWHLNTSGAGINERHLLLESH